MLDKYVYEIYNNLNNKTRDVKTMYKSFEEAKAAALDVIESDYGGDKMGCCVTESKLSKNSRRTYFGFVFYSEDTNGLFVRLEDGSYSKRTAI